MEDNRMNGAKAGIQKMLFYYLYSLSSISDDPKQQIASEIAEMIDLSEEQLQYVQANISQDNKLIENLSSSISLLEGMEKSKELDLESISIVKQILQIMIKQCKETFTMFDYEFGFNENNQEEELGENKDEEE